MNKRYFKRDYFSLDIPEDRRIGNDMLLLDADDFWVADNEPYIANATTAFFFTSGTVDVSINMTDFRVTPLYRVTELVKAEAARYGVQVIGTEVIGLCPMKALVDSAEYYLQIENFDFDNQVLENHIL